MALRWLEAGMACQNETIFARLYATVSGAVGNSYADEYARNLWESSNLILKTPAVVGSVANTWFVGFGFTMPTGELNTSPSAFPHVGLYDGVGEQLRIEVVAANDTKPGGSYYKLRVKRGATVLATTVERFSGANLPTRRVYFEFKSVVRTSTNGSFELKYHDFKTGVHTATWDAANTGINTANQGTDGADRFQFAWTTGDVLDRVSLTDIYVLDNTGSKNNDYLGVLYCEALKPAGTGTTNTWVLAGSAASVEDALDEGAATQSTLEDDRRITSDVVGDLTLATMSDLSSKIATTRIVGVQTRIFGKMETVGSRDVQFFYRKTTGSPAQIGTAILDLDSTTIVGEADTLESDPNTSADWVIADINGVQMGVELDA
jgi:hypothetical protein